MPSFLFVRLAVSWASSPTELCVYRGRKTPTQNYTLENSNDIVTGKSITAELHFINTTPIFWYSERQATVEHMVQSL